MCATFAHIAMEYQKAFIDGNGITTTSTHISVPNDATNNIKTQVNNNGHKEHSHAFPERKELVVAGKEADDHSKPSPSDINANDINMSQTHNSVQHCPMNPYNF